MCRVDPVLIGGSNLAFLFRAHAHPTSGTSVATLVLVWTRLHKIVAAGMHVWAVGVNRAGQCACTGM